MWHVWLARMKTADLEGAGPILIDRTSEFGSALQQCIKTYMLSAKSTCQDLL